MWYLKSQILKYINYIMNNWNVRNNSKRIVNYLEGKWCKILHVAEIIQF